MGKTWFMCRLVMRYDRIRRFDNLPQVEIDLLQKIEDRIEQPFIDNPSIYGGWGFGYEVEYDRLVSVSVNRRFNSGKHLDMIPDEIVEATELTRVNFGTNEIREIPKDLGNLT
ncbi:MAG: hypothetical protein IH840_07255, partial [Candidatus Heimdallarchaeota archaeon]|nr:hypothetical protein [Candidatus Heimdallarchaeota archaeon]